MTDPFDALREPAVPVAPDPSFAARLRERLTRAVFDQPDTDQPDTGQGAPMTTHTTRAAPAWPPSLTPYLVVADARAALAWYTDVFDARQRGEPHVDSDGTIGHMEIDIGDAVLMFSEASGLYPDVPVRAPDSPMTFSHSLHLEVRDVDDTVLRARRRGATIERPPTPQPYGRGGVIVDPFGHRWLLLQRPAHATPYRQGDVARATIVTPDPARAREFYETVLEVPFEPGTTPGSWRTADTRPAIAVRSPEDADAQVRLCYRVDDVPAAVTRVRAAGGTTQGAVTAPYGLVADCVDDQGTPFQLWQPPD